jgi:hypothetical protein
MPATMFRSPNHTTLTFLRDYYNTSHWYPKMILSADMQVVRAHWTRDLALPLVPTSGREHNFPCLSQSGINFSSLSQAPESTELQPAPFPFANLKALDCLVDIGVCFINLIYILHFYLFLYWHLPEYCSFETLLIR